MFDHSLAYHLTPGSSPRALTKLHAYLGALNVRENILRQRYGITEGRESRAIQLLRFLLAQVDIDALIAIPTDIDRFLRVVAFQKESIARIIDSVQNGVVRHNTFIVSSKKCAEHVIPVSCSDYLTDLPHGKGWTEWQKVRPVRLMSVDTVEMSFQLQGDALKYSQSPPTIAVVTIDPVALILQYVCFRSEYPQEKDRTTTVTYLHRHVVVPALLEGQLDTALKSLYLGIASEVLVSADVQKQISSATTVANGYGRSMSQLFGAVADIEMLLRDHASGTISTRNALTSLPLFQGNVVSNYVLSRRTQEIPGGRQYLWAEYLRDMFWIELSVLFLLRSGNHAERDAFMRVVRQDISLLRMTSFWESIRDPGTKTFVSDAFRRIELLTQA